MQPSKYALLLVQITSQSLCGQRAEDAWSWYYFKRAHFQWLVRFEGTGWGR